VSVVRRDGQLDKLRGAVRLPGALKRLALAGLAFIGAWTAFVSVACGGSGCKTPADCRRAARIFCCAGACVADDGANCGKCGASCALATTCSSDECTGSSTSACAITEATTTTSDGACDLSHRGSASKRTSRAIAAGTAGTCTVPIGRERRRLVLVPVVQPDDRRSHEVATLCNVSPPTP